MTVPDCNAVGSTAGSVLTLSSYMHKCLYCCFAIAWQHMYCVYMYMLVARTDRMPTVSLQSVCLRLCASDAAESEWLVNKQRHVFRGVTATLTWSHGGIVVTCLLRLTSACAV